VDEVQIASSRTDVETISPVVPAVVLCDDAPENNITNTKR
jgi:hypothetical protein